MQIVREIRLPVRAMVNESHSRPPLTGKAGIEPDHSHMNAPVQSE